MRRQTGGRANLFLMELVLNLLIFALCAAVCMGLLARARGMSRESAQLTDAVYAAQTAAEEWRSGLTGGEDWCPAELIRDGAADACKFLTEDGRAIPAAEAAGFLEKNAVAYTLTLAEEGTDGLHTARIAVYAGYLGEELYTLFVTVPEEVSAQ